MNETEGVKCVWVNLAKLVAHDYDLIEVNRLGDTFRFVAGK